MSELRQKIIDRFSFTGNWPCNDYIDIDDVPKIINLCMDAAIKAISQIKVTEESDMTHTEQKYFNFGIDGSCDVIESLKEES